MALAVRARPRPEGDRSAVPRTNTIAPPPKWSTSTGRRSVDHDGSEFRRVLERGRNLSQLDTADSRPDRKLPHVYGSGLPRRLSSPQHRSAPSASREAKWLQIALADGGDRPITPASRGAPDETHPRAARVPGPSEALLANHCLVGSAADAREICCVWMKLKRLIEQALAERSQNDQ